MSFAHSPQIVTNGLVLALDAGNIKSYPGTGTTWFDKSGNGYNGTLTNGPTFSSANGGSIVFDGVNDYITGLNNTFMNGATSGSFEAWINTSNVGSPYYMIYNTIIGKASGPDNGFGFNNNGTLLLRLNNVNTSGTTTVPLNAWNYVVGTWDATNVKIYLNGTLETNNATAGRSWEASVYATEIGRVYQGSGGGSFTGKIANCKVYNRALSASEVQQNFNALRGRFGI